MSNGTTAIQQQFARTDCVLNGHHYHATWTVGHFVCLMCGKRAVCPVCVPQMSDTTQHLALCTQHRPKEERV